MKAETFFCPHCSANLTKSSAAWVLGESGQENLAENMISEVICPSCGKGINTRKMVAGDYDHSNNSELVGFLIIIGCIALVFFTTEFSFWPSAGIGIILAIVVSIGINFIENLIKKKA